MYFSLRSCLTVFLLVIWIHLILMTYFFYLFVWLRDRIEYGRTCSGDFEIAKSINKFTVKISFFLSCILQIISNEIQKMKMNEKRRPKKCAMVTSAKFFVNGAKVLDHLYSFSKNHFSFRIEWIQNIWLICRDKVHLYFLHLNCPHLHRIPSFICRSSLFFFYSFSLSTNSK